LTEHAVRYATRGEAVDVAVLGGGNAGLCAALAARQSGASVIVIECAPKEFRGGNSRHTRNLRSMHDRPTDLLVDAYSEDEFLTDLMRVTAGRMDEALARRVVRDSADCPRWIRSFGARLQPPLRGTLHLDRTNVFFLGGGKALMNSYYAAAERSGVRVLYNAGVEGVEIRDGLFRSVLVKINGQLEPVIARAVVLAAGGFESNLDWLKEVWGLAADNFIVRGTPYNTGKVLRLMLDHGAQPVGDPSQFHCVAIDARAPKFDGGIVTRLDCVSLGIVVNREPAETRRDVHVPRTQGRRAGSRAHAGRRTVEEHHGRWGDHGRQHPGSGLRGGCRYDYRHRVRPDRGSGGCPTCSRLTASSKAPARRAEATRRRSFWRRASTS
jgi:precorrin 3B synthase CobZ